MRASILHLVVIAGVAAVSGCAARHPAATAPPAATPTGTATALGPLALAAWWDAHHVALPPAPLLTHDDVVAAVARAVDADTGRVTREVVGRSVEGRDLVLGSIPIELPFWMKFDTDPNTIAECGENCETNCIQSGSWVTL